MCTVYCVCCILYVFLTGALHDAGRARAQARFKMCIVEKNIYIICVKRQICDGHTFCVESVGFENWVPPARPHTQIPS